ncbi:class II aldolase/adducin family protein [Agrobacterium sp. CMT1]|uniref:class II aldolase/adducin family protein n=1 Tax=Agrobacterium TaxID=357 RepID=UPI000696C6B1|nr:class II aldolase/adducin family protein [Agrobacterium pusense]MDR6192205.1 ribulose-5-phosphate 4-epimerase/fuculose-1-phosphate aldolase [Agrobacterium pusense]OAI82178.1 hypothetical protein AYO27_19425 [Rhizobium sp. GHKF11]
MVADLQTLVTISRQLGSEVGYIQGGGGNTSLKVNDDEMYIKASGRSLAEVDAENGFLAVNWRQVKAGLSTCETEGTYSELLAESSFSADKTVRPSIETGFHALLGRCVVHSHSVWSNILNCSEEGPAIIGKLFPNALWIEYETPGLHLTKAIMARTNKLDQQILFLQNHGLIVWADDEKNASILHQSVNDKIREHFNGGLQFPAADVAVPLSFRDGLLFPDQAVYQSNIDLAHSRAGRETMLACDFILHNIIKLGLTVNFIRSSEKDVLLNLETEKYRQRLITE